MTLVKLSAEGEKQLANWVQDFSVDYQAHFLQLIDHAFSERFDEKVAAQLAAVLSKWGACKRESAKLRSTADICLALNNPSFLKDLHLLQNVSLTLFRTRKLLLGWKVELTDEKILDEVGAALWRAVHHISISVLKDANTLTYPSKVLLLLGVNLPAVDSNVRRGLSFLSGFNSSPLHLERNDLAKYFGLFWLVADFEAAYGDQARRLAPAEFEMTKTTPGRLCDIVFFGADPHEIRSPNISSASFGQNFLKYIPSQVDSYPDTC